jgi:Rieske Fe-S protein
MSKDKKSKKSSDGNIEEELPRREFFKKSLLWTGIALVPLPALIQSCETYKELTAPAAGQSRLVDIHQMDEKLGFPPLEYVGVGIFQKFPRLNYGIPVLIIRIKEEEAEDSFVCYSSMCTHAHCFGPDKISQPISNVGEDSLIICSCHGSKYDPFHGARVVHGPAEKPLKQFRTLYHSDTGMVEIFF